VLEAILKSHSDEDICLMIQPDNHSFSYLCDCGIASDLSIADCQRIAAIFISHTHIDHFCNFDTILRHQLGIQKTVIILGPQGIAKQVQAKIMAYTWNLIEANAICYEIREVQEEQIWQTYELLPPEWNLKILHKSQDEIIFENEVFKVRYTLLNHGIPTVAYLFEEYDKIKILPHPFKAGKWIKELKEAFELQQPKRTIVIEEQSFLAENLFEYLIIQKGYSIGYVMDYLANESNFQKIINLFKNIDELYIESYYKDADLNYALKNNHSTAKASGEVARRANVKRVVPVHHSRRYGNEVEHLKEECLAAFEGRIPRYDLLPNINT
jgi:ribonuclease Z